jgi:hypothetical protein
MLTVSYFTQYLRMPMKPVSKWQIVLQYTYLLPNTSFLAVSNVLELLSAFSRM